jgi:segregation and condensation protein A
VDGIASGPATDRDWKGFSPLLDLDGFTGRLEGLLVLAQARQIDLAAISLPGLVTQLTAALRNASGRTPLGLQGDWVVMAAWLVLLRSRLLLPADAMTQDTAKKEAAQLRHGLVKLVEVQAAAGWLETRQQLGRDVFNRGQPEWIGIDATTAHQVDVIEFLWASLALFDDDLPGADTAATYRTVWLDLHAITDARDRILRRMEDQQAPCPLDQFLPDLTPCRRARCEAARAGPAPSWPASNWPSRVTSGSIKTDASALSMSVGH